ncbi:7,8-didemethyl-8-hydroxy-5-deazariboflavin synthase subunit CofH [Halodesulfurarchaeum sp. HSR-GB]|uniref:7,8-didemethyl-8-hydroxy-5-deazariboflavin synthase subunit CofH n=1 Tax=Halodesulfurarchaeum sp. HSR-GB TaxID=3074077 RepID=UPI00285A9D6F|nr:7,8-didemethyl-8-hydroxy-5-deazariboflavin synthase subunit CofH [Halodesulfurarchaeum sp. HSR-GB]MDR5656252.1 7,8-didemethyl-8-hydroxy-5-deazariboflavin synthase subunit CofH [Halodesulfurarchaeum sp. HSR-GB]
MGDGPTLPTGVPREQFDFEIRPETDQSFENALARARAGDRLTIADAIELLTTGSDRRGIDPERLEAVVTAADRRREEVVGESVTFVANLNNNVTTACDTGCLFCNYRDSAHTFETGYGGDERGYTRTPAQSRSLVLDAVRRGVSEVTTVSGLHPALALDDEHREILAAESGPSYRPPAAYRTDPGTYAEQLRAMSVDGLHVHSMTPEEADHARRGTDWDFETVYRRLSEAGLDSVPGTAAEILIEEVREVICPGKIDTQGWLDAMRGAAAAGLPMTATMLYGHVENEAHRARHLARIRELQDRTGAITEFVPLSFVHHDTPLARRGLVSGGATLAEDRLVVAVARLFLDNVEHVQASWVKHGDDLAKTLLAGGADDLSGTLLAESITSRAGGDHGEFRSVAALVDLIDDLDRVPVERSTDYERRHRIDPERERPGPVLGPLADGTPLLAPGETVPKP